MSPVVISFYRTDLYSVDLALLLPSLGSHVLECALMDESSTSLQQ